MTAFRSCYKGAVRGSATRILLGSLLFAAAASLVLAASSNASAGTATPTPTPQTAPAGSATITLRNKFDDISTVVLVDPRLTGAKIGDQFCTLTHTADVQAIVAIDLQTDWPWSNSPPCNLVGLPVQICVTVGVCSDEFTFDGSDAKVDVNWPEPPFEGVPLAHARFVRDGSPHSVTITGLHLEAVGHACLDALLTSAAPPVTVSDLSHPSCGVQGETEAARFTTAEFGDLTATFANTGADIDYDVVVPGASTSTPTPSPSPTVTAAKLPEGGGAPSATGGTLPYAASIAGGVAALLGARLIWRRRSV
ncbi:MAG TPA: hypothetical protein VMT90_09540 [Dehalococcoidia bacterium]|nr:hypothetical protein [Dehalococcoidia bacterium]